MQLEVREKRLATDHLTAFESVLLSTWKLLIAFVIAAGCLSSATAATAAASETVAGSADASTAAGTPLACCQASSSGCLCTPCSLHSGTAGSDWRQLVIVKQEAARDLCWQLDHWCCGRHHAARLVQWRSCTSGPRSCSQPTCHQCCFGSIRCDYSLCIIFAPNQDNLHRLGQVPNSASASTCGNRQL